MEREVKGKIIIVTGSADGLGLTMVDSFLSNGAKLAILLDVNESKGNESAAALRKKYGEDKAVFYKCNVETDLDDIFQKIVGDYKNVDVLVNNAGVLDERNIKSVKRTMGVNAIAVMEWTLKFHEHMRKDKGGKGGTIINVSSIYGRTITPFIPFYHASKYAVLGFSKSLGDEYNYKRSGVRVVTLCPGLTKSNMANNPHAWEEEISEDFIDSLGNYPWQTAEFIGDGIVELFKKAESGSVWLVEGENPAQKWDV